MRYLLTIIVVSGLLIVGCGESSNSGNGSGGETNHGSSAQADGRHSADADANPADANPAAAEAADGTITATLNGQTKTWYILSRELGGAVRSHSEWQEVGPTRMITLWGHASPDSMSTDQSFSLSFHVVGEGEARTINDAELTYLTGKLSDMHTSPEGSKVPIEITGLEVDGEKLTIAGTFSGWITQRAPGELKPSEGSQIMVSDGVFEATLHQPSM